jgi:SAM-dependent methyltransferase
MDFTTVFGNRTPVSQLPHTIPKESPDGDPIWLYVKIDLIEGKIAPKIDLQINWFDHKPLPKACYESITAPAHPYPENFRNIHRTSHMVSAKADGERSGLYIDASGKAFYASFRTARPEMYPIGHCENKQYYESYCDAELMTLNVEKQRIPAYLLLFDLMLFAGEISSELAARVQQCKEIVHSIQLNECSPIAALRTKNYFHFSMLSRVLRSGTEPLRDGIIFTPKMSSPGEGCVRWKPTPTITARLVPYESDEITKGFMGQFPEKLPRKRRGRYRYYNFENEYPCPKRHGTFFEYAEIAHVRNMEGIEYVNLKNPPLAPLVEFTMHQEPMSHLRYYVALRIRNDRTSADTIETVERLLPMVKYPLSLNNLLRIRPSYYNGFHVPRRRERALGQHHGKIKEIVYDRFCSGRVLDMGSGYSQDIFRHVRNLNVKSVTCLEKDPELFREGKDMTMPIRTDDYGRPYFRTRMLHGDFNDVLVFDRFGIKPESYDTIVSAFTFQYMYDKEWNHLTRTLRVGGRLVLLFMDGERLKPARKVAKHLRHESCDCHRHPSDLKECCGSEEEIHTMEDRCENCKRIHTNSRSNESPIEMYYQHEAGVLDKALHYVPSSRVWVQLPTTRKPVLEALIRIPDLIQRMQFHGMQMLYMQHFPEILANKRLESVSKLYCAMVFEKKGYESLQTPFLCISSDPLSIVFTFLEHGDLMRLAQVHRRFTNECNDYLERKPHVWEDFQQKREYQCCDYILSYS